MTVSADGLRQRIVDSADRCERQLALESVYLGVGDYLSAADCADNAEIDSSIAFRAAALL